MPREEDHHSLGDSLSGGADIVLIADGWPRSAFLDLLDHGDLPEIQGELIEAGSLYPNIVSNVPSVSIASHASILTASPQDKHLIPGHRWVAAGSNDCHNYLTLRGPRNVNRDLSASVPTIFESPQYQHSIAVQSIVDRGATISTRLATFRSGPILRRLGDLIIDHPSSVSVAWLPRVDAICHRKGPDHADVKDEMRVTSAHLGKLIRRLASRGILERARIALVPDHGQRKVLYSTHLEKVFDDLGYHLALNPRSPRSADVLAMTSGDGSAYLYPMRPDVSHADLAQRLVSRKEIELACVVDAYGQSTIYSGNGTAVARPLVDGLEYSVVDGTDPLGLIDSARIAFPDLRNPSIQGRYPDFLHQYLHSYVPGRSSQLLIFAAKSTNFVNGPRVGYRFGYHRGTHGGPFAEDVLVAAAVRGCQPENAERPVRSAALLREIGMMNLATETVVGLSHGA